MKKIIKNPYLHFVILGLILALVPKMAEMGLIKTSI